MMKEAIEHNEHRRKADDEREPVAWAGRTSGEPRAADAAPTSEQGA